MQSYTYIGANMQVCQRTHFVVFSAQALARGFVTRYTRIIQTKFINSEHYIALSLITYYFISL